MSRSLICASLVACALALSGCGQTTTTSKKPADKKSPAPKTSSTTSHTEVKQTANKPILDLPSADKSSAKPGETKPAAKPSESTKSAAKTEPKPAPSTGSPVPAPEPKKAEPANTTK